jgi:hypothetical protein
MILRLPELVSSPLPINNIREDLQINFKTAARWPDISERLYSIFELLSLGNTVIKAVKKRGKTITRNLNTLRINTLRINTRGVKRTKYI